MDQENNETTELVRLSKGHGRLMQVLSERIDDGMLQEIASADYKMGYEGHLAALTVIRARDVPKGRMAWEPQEVLELFRWSEFGDNRSGRRDRPAEDFHIMRAFCCVAILTAYADPENYEYFEGNNSTLIQLLDSLEMVGIDAKSYTVPFLAWLLCCLPDNEDERAFFILGLVWALVRSRRVDDEATVTSALIDCVFACEKSVRDEWGNGFGRMPNRWLFGTTFFNARFEKWERLGARLVIEAEAVRDAKLRSQFNYLACRLKGDGGD
jgi:hypothetical protein